MTTVAEEKAQNVHVGHATAMDEFVAMRASRDATLSAPRWSAFSIPANLKCMNLQGIRSLMAASASHERH